MKILDVHRRYWIDPTESVAGSMDLPLNPASVNYFEPVTPEDYVPHGTATVLRVIDGGYIFISETPETFRKLWEEALR